MGKLIKYLIIIVLLPILEFYIWGEVLLTFYFWAAYAVIKMLQYD